MIPTVWEIMENAYRPNHPRCAIVSVFGVTAYCSGRLKEFMPTSLDLQWLRAIVIASKRAGVTLDVRQTATR